MIIKQISGLILSVIVIYSGIFCVTFSTVPQSLAVLLMSVVSLIGLIVYLVQSSEKTPSLNTGLKLVTALTFVYFLARAYFSEVGGLARQDLFLIVSAAMLYGILTQTLPSKALRKYVSMGFIILMILNILMLIPVVNHGLDSFLNFSNGTSNSGLFNHKSLFGNFVALMSCFTLSYAMLGERNKRLRIGAFVLSLLGCAAVVISSSRGSFFALIGGVSVVILCWFVKNSFKHNRINKNLISYVSIVVLLFVGIGGYIGGKHILEERDTTLSESNSRIYYFAVTLAQIPDAPIIGSGSRSVEYKSYENWSLELADHLLDFKFTHNEYLQSVADYGIVGFLLLLIVLFWHLLTGFRVYFNALVTGKHANISYVVGGISILVASSIHMLFSFPAHGYINLLLMMMAATWCLGRVNESVASKRQAKVLKLNSLSWVGLLAVCLLYSILQGGKELQAATMFWSNEIIVDDKNWEPEEIDTYSWSSALTKVVEVSPTYDRYNKLGVLYLREDNVAKAIECFEKSRVLHPYEPVSRLNLANIYSDENQFSLAEKEYLSCEYMLKNREPVFMFYQKLAEFYNEWAIAEPSRSNECLMKARNACDQSLDKKNGYLFKELMQTKKRTLLLSYYELMKQREEELAFGCFDELITISRSTNILTEADANGVLSVAREMIKHAKFVWSRGQLQRAANILHGSKKLYHRYYGFMRGKEERSWHVEDKQIDEALSILKQAGISTEIK